MNPAADPNVIDTGWIPCPAESHVLKIRRIDQFFSDAGRPSELRVVFKEYVPKTPRGKYRPPTMYIYESLDHTFLNAVFGSLEVASSPGTEIWAQLIRPGVAVRGPLTPD